MTTALEGGKGIFEEEIHIPAVAGLRWSHQIHEECVGRWSALLDI